MWDMDETQAIRVVIVAGDPLARAGLAALLTTHAGCAVVGQLADDGDPATTAATFRPAALVWDLGWEAGLEDNAATLPEFDELAWPVVALVPDAALVPAVLAAGARGVLPRDTAPDLLLAALGAAVAGLSVFDPALAGSLLPGPSRTLVDRLAAEFTPRELDVLRLLVDGLSNKGIAVQLAISENTVKFHLNAILGKLNAQSRTEAVVSAIRLGVITV